MNISTIIKRTSLAVLFVLLLLSRGLMAQTVTIAGQDLETFDDNIFSTDQATQFSEFLFSTSSLTTLNELEVYTIVGTSTPIKLLQDDGAGGFTEIGEFDFDSGTDQETRDVDGGGNENIETSTWTASFPVLAIADYKITGDFYHPMSEVEQYKLTGSTAVVSESVTLAGSDFIGSVASFDLYASNQSLRFKMNSPFVLSELTLIVEAAVGDITLSEKVGDTYTDVAVLSASATLETGNPNVRNVSEQVDLAKRTYTTDVRVFPPGEYELDVRAYNSTFDGIETRYDYASIDDALFFKLRGLALGPVRDMVERGEIQFGDMKLNVPLGGIFNSSRIQGEVELSYKMLNGDWSTFARVFESSSDQAGGSIEQLYYDGGRGGRYYYLEILDPTVHYQYALGVGTEGINYLELSVYKEDLDNKSGAFYFNPPLNSNGQPCTLEESGKCFPQRDSLVLNMQGRLDFSDPFLIEEDPLFNQQYQAILGNGGLVEDGMGTLTSIIIPFQSTGSLFLFSFSDILETQSLTSYGISNQTLYNGPNSFNGFLLAGSEFIGSGDFRWLEFEVILEARRANSDELWSTEKVIPAENGVVGEFLNQPYEFRNIAIAEFSNQSYSGLRSSNSSFDMTVRTRSFEIEEVNSNPIIFRSNAWFLANPTTDGWSYDLSISNSTCDETISLSFNLDGIRERFQTRNQEIHIYRQQIGLDTELLPYDTLSPGTSLPYDISWTDINTTEGVEYAYSIVTRLNHNDSRYPVLQTDTLSAIASLPTEVPTDIQAISTTTSDERYIDLNWIHDDPRNTGFKIIKRWEVDGVIEEEEIDITGDVLTYRDNDLIDCIEYVYQVGSVGDCQPEGEFDEDESVVVIAEPFLREIISPDVLSASKGYFSNSVLLDWTYNGESTVLDNVNIYKRVLGDDVVPSPLPSVIAQELSYVDEAVDNNVYYEYFLVVEGTCQGDQFDSYDINRVVGLDLPGDLPEFGVGYAVGFKNSSAVITGNISYEGGIGVPDVRVAVDRERDSNGNLVSDQAGSNLYFDGTDQDTAKIATSSFLTFTKDLSLMTWISPQDTLRAEQSLLYQADAYELRLEESEVVFSVRDAGGIWQETRTHMRFDFDKFTHVTATVGADSMALYIDGRVADVLHLSSFGFHTTSNDILLGHKTASDHYYGYLDELRIFIIQLDKETVLRDHQRIIPSNTEGLAAYWRLDEGISGATYDAARTGNVFHQNDFQLNGAEWSTNLPTVEQLAVAAYTNQSGNYVIDGITFQGIGENLTISPRITLNGAIHEFSPQERGLFIGEGNLINNNIDFTDISSFEVSGQAFYAFETVDMDSTVGVEGASFLLNGITPLFNSDNQPVTTDDEGLFSISVPIGNHFIQIRKNGHVFDEGGRFPAEGTFDFQDDVFGVVFYDTTRLSLKGKVVGGLREGDKKLGDPSTKNNIGQTTFTLQYPSGAIPSFEVVVVTDTDNGEYSVELPPLPFFLQGNNIEYTKNLVEVPFTENFEEIDMSDKFVVQYDTLEYYDNGELDRIDSVGYNFKQNFVYRIEPNILVTNNSGGQVFGNDTFTYGDGTDEAVEIPLYTVDGSGQPTYSLGYPVFSKHMDYVFKIKLRETYTNVDNNDQDEVPVTDGVLSIANNWGESYFIEDGDRLPYPQGSAGTDQIQVDNEDGEITYSFLALTPDPADQGLNSFTKTFQISANTGGNNTVFYPGPAQGDVARAYIFGSRVSDGSSFITSGPDRVDFILRDPQGSDSYSYWETGSVLETEEIMRWDVGQDLEVEANVGFSMTTWVGVGGGTVNTVGSTVDVNFSESFKAGEENVRVSTVETTQRYQTSDENVGSSGDVFIGKSENFTYGGSTNVYLIPSNECQVDDKNVCPNNMAEVTHEGQAYKVGVKPGFFLSPNGEITYFVFTQFHIEETLIPTLRQVRNAVLTGNPDYEAVFTNTDDPEFDLKYGSNNDDPIWGDATSTDNYPKTDDDDFIGQSYHFTPTIPEDDDQPGPIDSIRWANQQIRLWTDALKRNEEDKLKAIDAEDQLFENLSISGGNQFNFETSTSAKESREEFYELDLALGTGSTIEFNAFGLENDIQFRPSITSSTQSRTITTETETSTVGFELLDRDSEDLLNISVLNSQFGFGPIFRNRDGGITSCPYEPAEYTKYYHPDSLWSTGTLQIDKPRLEVEVPQVFNVPSDESAVFTLNLFNDSETNSDVNYLMKLVDGTNQDGAVLRIDGSVLTDGREFFIHGGSAIQKTLTLERGPLKFDYEGVQIQLMSSCQNDPTGFFEAIADTVSLSANFIPTCTDIAVIDPEPNFTLNNSVDSLVNIAIGAYDINFSGLEKIDIEFKASESNDWTKLATYWYDTTGRDDPDTLQIPRSVSQINYQWNISSGIPDGNYDLRTLASCLVPTVFDENNNPLTYIDVVTTSEVASGLLDTVDPHIFGAPQPSDGVLSAGEEISVQFNEPINIGILQNTNFTITGELNGGSQSHPASLYFDGTEDQFVEIPSPADLSRKSFSIDLYAKRNATGEAVLFSISQDDQNEISVGFNVADQLYFSINGEQVVSPTAITDNNWHHIAATYQHNAQDASLYIDGDLAATDSEFIIDFNTMASIYLARSQYAPTRPFDGNLHELRLWNRQLLETDVSKVAVRKLNSGEPGLISNWRLEDGRGTIARDIIRQKNGTISASWQIEPNGLAYEFDGTSDLLYGTSPSFDRDSDFSIEFWVNADAVSDSVTFISNGRGDLVDENKSGWSIGTDASGLLIVRTVGGDIATGLEVADGFWHHVALTLNRFGSVAVFLDGDEIAAVEATEYPGFGGPRLWIGARGWFDGSVFKNDQYFSGAIDEVRLWNLARRASSIENDLYNKLQSDETGLALYYPLETFGTGPLGGIAVNATQNLVTGENASTNALLGSNAANFTSATPPILIPKQVQTVPFSVSANRDQVILSPQIDLDKIEDVILNITAKNIRDLNGNRLASPVSWTAFVDQNTLIWDETSLAYEIEQGAGFSFKVTIRNIGGDVEDFSLANLPAWLTASTTSGSLSPLSSLEVTFTVDEAVNTGTYLEDIILSSNSGVNERLLLDVKVKTPLPADWLLDESAYAFSMNVIGRMKIVEEFSRDPDDRLAAFAGDEIRGVGVPQYFEIYDSYQVFMTIFSNDTANTEAITYKIWNASEGRVHTGITASDDRVETFSRQSIHGSTTAPVVFEAGDDLQQSIALDNGWNWISFNLASNQLQKSELFLGDLPAAEGDLIKFRLIFDSKSLNDGWLGKITDEGGFNTGELYKLRISSNTTLQYDGTIIDATTSPISVGKGWNWIGFLPQENIAINEALASFNATSGDLLKSQSTFAIYDTNIGWLGSLTSLKPGEGYMLQAANVGSITYPASGLVNGRRNDRELLDNNDQLFAQWGFNPARYSDNMTIISSLVVEDELADLPIGAYIDGELRGIATPILLPQNGETRYFIAVAGDTNGKLISFKALSEDGTTTDLIGEQGFSTNALLGSLDSPVELRWPTAADLLARQVDIFPNPFDQSITLQLLDDFHNLGTVEIRDVSGKLVRLIEPPTDKIKQVVWDGRGASGGQLPGGIYLMRIQIGNELITKRVVKN